MIVLGVDASTSATGVVILDDSIKSKNNLLFYGAEIFKGCETFWSKCDAVRKYFEGLKSISTGADALKAPNLMIDSFFIEEPLKRFATGFSSASTISMLQRFNGIVCYLARETFGVDPTYINVSSARKLAGIKVVPKKKAGGLSAKEQTFEQLSKGDLSDIAWPKKQRSQNIVDWSRDVADAYVVAKGGLLLNKK